MTVSEFLAPLDGRRRITFKDMDGNEICTCKNDSEGVEPYNDRKVVKWGVFLESMCGIGLEITLGEEKCPFE